MKTQFAYMAWILTGIALWYVKAMIENVFKDVPIPYIHACIVIVCIHVLFEFHRAHWFYHQEVNPWKRFEQTGDLNADNFKHGLGLVQWAHHEKREIKWNEKKIAKFQYSSNLDWLDARLALQATCSILWWKYFSCDDQYTYNKNNDDEKIKRRMKMRTKSTD